MKKENYVFLTAGIIVLIDQIAKFFVAKMQLFQSIPLIPNILHFTYTQNTGAGFGIFRGFNTGLIWVSLIIIGTILYNMDKVPDKQLPRLGFGFVLGGAIGNLIDRISFSYVIDFIDFRIWPTFNLADSFITIGAVLLIIHYWKR
ncbi:MAG: signal peptidase II [Nanoarchaeota archaeon]|nr:signal peptidase II [Nanoarchaeota archaeon]